MAAPDRCGLRAGPAGWTVRRGNHDGNLLTGFKAPRNPRWEGRRQERKKGGETKQVGFDLVSREQAALAEHLGNCG